MNEIKLLNIFIMAAELGSFNRVAIREGCTPQSVSKSIRELEKHLGIKLFHRTTRSNVLTEDGECFFTAVRPKFSALNDVLDSARKLTNEPEGLIRISAAKVVGKSILIPLISEFRLYYPRICFEFILEERFSDLINEKIDVGFRAGGAPDAQVVARRLFSIQDIPCASKEYLKKFGIPLNLKDLSRHNCTGYRSPTTGRMLAWEFADKGNIEYFNPEVIFSANDTETEMEAVMAGMGIGLIDSINSVPKIQKGELIPVLTDYISSRRGLYIYYNLSEVMPRRQRVFIDFAIERLSNDKRFIASSDELKRSLDSFISNNMAKI